MKSSARKHWIKRVAPNFPAHCIYPRNCSDPVTFQFGWTFDRKVDGQLVECVTSRTACEKHGRVFAFKHNLQLPRSVA